MRLVVDIETDGLVYEDIKNIWCISVCNLDDPTKIYSYSDHYNYDGKHGLKDGVKELAQADELVLHNGLLYDIPVIQKFFPDFKPKGVCDTFVLSNMFTPDRPAGHKLESYGRKFGIPKYPDLDWSKWSDEMITRCETDVKITVKLDEHFSQIRSKWDWERSIRMEHVMFQLQAQQERNGVHFNKEKADVLLEKIDVEVSKLDEELLDKLPYRCVQPYKVPVNEPFLKDGRYRQSVIDWFEDEEKRGKVKGPFSRILFQPFNLNSDQQIKDYLLAQGWKPTQYNYKKVNGRVVYENGKPVKTSPKLSEDSFKTIKGNLGQLVARRNILVHRRRNIKNYEDDTKGWYNRVRPDGRIEARGIPCATPTARYRHSQIVNVPKNKKSVVYGKECRELFDVEPPLVMVGCDAKGLEARMEAHYCYIYKGGKEYAAELIDGDIHANNAAIFGLKDRDDAKAPKYALTYGCQPPKLRTLLGCSMKTAKLQWNAFWDGNTALKGLRDNLERAFARNRTFVKGLDGRKIFIRSKHALVNAIIQSGGSIVVKTAMCYVWNVYVPKETWTVIPKLLIQQHDEFQAEVHPDDVPKYKAICEKAFIKAGKYFKINVPILADVKVGQNWAECH